MLMFVYRPKVFPEDIVGRTQFSTNSTLTDTQDITFGAIFE